VGGEEGGEWTVAWTSPLLTIADISLKELPIPKRPRTARRQYVHGNTSPRLGEVASADGAPSGGAGRPGALAELGGFSQDDLSEWYGYGAERRERERQAAADNPAAGGYVSESRSAVQSIMNQLALQRMTVKAKDMRQSEFILPGSVGDARGGAAQAVDFVAAARSKVAGLLFPTALSNGSFLTALFCGPRPPPPPQAFPRATTDFFCFDHKLPVPPPPPPPPPPPGAGGAAAAAPPGDGWDVFSSEREFRRARLLGAPGWRMIDQSPSFWLCRTYPGQIMVPADISDAEIRRAAAHRARNRLPVAVWAHTNGATLARCAQPLIGLRNARCREDEKLVWHLACGGAAGGEAEPRARGCCIIDARSKAASNGNRLMGKGTEKIEHYGNGAATMKHMRIGNIHTLRKSYERMQKLCQPARSAADFVQKLGDAGWLHHVHMVMAGIVQTAHLLHNEETSVLVHCSDGWDRTAQLCAGAQLLLDPFCRTIEGLQVVLWSRRSGVLLRLSDGSMTAL
jgi:hypothetical protein